MGGMGRGGLWPPLFFFMTDQPQGETFFEFEFKNAQFRCELFDRGPKGFEARIFKNNALQSAKLCETLEVARQWAFMERTMIEHG